MDNLREDKKRGANLNTGIISDPKFYSWLNSLAKRKLVEKIYTKMFTAA